MKKFKKILGMTLALTIAASLATGCASKKSATDAEGRTVISIGDCLSKEISPKAYENLVDQIARFEEANPDIKIEMDTYTYNVQTYAAKAEAGTLPTVYYVPLTESKNIMDMGYAADITEYFKKFGFYDNVNDFILEQISRDEKIYFLPTSCYDMGLAVNIDLLKQAGYVAEDGTPHQPETWDEMVEMAVKIKEVTGKNGFVLPTTDNCGGWRFTPIAWSYGVEFMKQDADGKWKATFDSQEMVDALQFVKDLKWKYDILPENTLVKLEEIWQLMGTGEVAMTLGEINQIDCYSNYGATPDSIGIVKMPAGPAKRVALMGGGYDVINANATPEQIEAVFKWETFKGNGVTLTEDIKKSISQEIETRKEKNRMLGVETLSPWKEDCEVRKYRTEEYAKNLNLNINHIKLYNDKSGVEYQAEEPIEAQALYTILDGCVQEVLTNKNADCAELAKKAAADFQSNYLD